MRDYETIFIDQVSTRGAIESSVALGIDERHFDDEDNQRVFKYLKDYFIKYKTPPTFTSVSERFPDRKWETVSDPLDFVRDSFLRNVKLREAIETHSRQRDLLERAEPENIDKIDEIFLDDARNLAEIIPASSVSRFSSMPSRISLYKDRLDEDIPLGIPFGVPGLDEITTGIQAHEYITIAGWTGIGKSTLALYFCIQHYLQGYTPLVISLEMDAEELYRKLDAIAVGLRQQALKKLELNSDEMERWEEFAEKVANASKDIIVVDVWNATPENVYAQTSRWRPDVVVVDYIQLLAAPKNFRATWERVDYTSKMMKQMARQLRIPVYGLAQTNADSSEDGARLSNLAGSKNIGQHSDLVLALHQDEEMEQKHKVDIRVEKNRGGPKGTVEMYFNHTKAQYREWQYDDDWN